MERIWMIRESRTGWGGLGSSNDEIPQRIIILSLATRVQAAKAIEAELSSCRRSKEVCMFLNQKGMKTIYNHPFWMILYTLFQIIHICMSIVSLFRRLIWSTIIQIICIWKALVINFWMNLHQLQTIHYWMIHVIHFWMTYSSAKFIHYWKILVIWDVCTAV